MDFSILERRRDYRTQAFTPISFRCVDSGDERPAHLMDLSYGGAGILTTAYNAPRLGEYVDLEFETADNDGGSESRKRRETARVVNLAVHERGVKRIGLRFMQHPDISSGLFDPIDLLSDHRKSANTPGGDRWQTARHFDRPELASSAAH